MHATKMHFAFVTSKSVNQDTPLGRLILKTAVKHHEAMVAELKAKQEAKQAKEVVPA